MPAITSVTQAYRHLLRGLLRAVQFSSPARYEVRDGIRDAFRAPDGVLPDPDTLKRTLWFLDAAARETGLEHRILRNLLTVSWQRRHMAALMRGTGSTITTYYVRQEGYRHYELTLAMMNKTMGLCLR